MRNAANLPTVRSSRKAEPKKGITKYADARKCKQCSPHNVKQSNFGNKWKQTMYHTVRDQFPDTARRLDY